MNKIHIEYFDGLLTNEEIDDITQSCSNEYVGMEFHKKESCIMNAALDELIGQLILYIPPSEVLAIASTTIIPVVCTSVKKIREIVKERMVKKVTPNSIEEKEPNIIIQAGNMKILLPKDTSSCDVDKYLSTAIKSTVDCEHPQNTEIIVSGDDKAIHIETLEKYAYRIMQPKIKQQNNEAVDYSKLEDVFTNALLRVVEEKEKREREFLEEKEKEEKNTNKNNKVRSFFMRLCNWAMYAIVYIVSAYCFYIMCQVKTDSGTETFVKVMFLFGFGVIAVFMFLSQFESFYDSQKEGREHFNSNIGFAALIVALIALFKGVG